MAIILALVGLAFLVFQIFAISVEIDLAVTMFDLLSSPIIIFALALILRELKKKK